MDKKNRLKQLLQKFTGTDDKTLEAFQNFDTAASKLKSDLKEKMQVATLDRVNGQLSDFQKKIDFQPLVTALEELKSSVQISDNEMRGSLEERLLKIRAEISEARSTNKDTMANLTAEIQTIETKLDELSQRKPPEFPDFLTPIKESEGRMTAIINSLEKYNDTELKKEVADLEDTLKKLRQELITRINDRGGGSMNRQIKFNGVNYLTKYTDINYKAGTNVTFTVVNNNQTKMVDVTIDATGGSGGTVRSINSVSTNTVAGSASGTDYVYLCSGTMTLTLPTALLNTNLYTIKNVGTGVVTVNTTSAQTIDNDLTAVMPVRYTSIDVISDTANWNIT